MKFSRQGKISVTGCGHRSVKSLGNYDFQKVWEEAKESKRRKRKLEQQLAVERSMKEVPTINANSRRKAEKILSKSQKSLLNLGMPEDLETESNHNQLLLKNSLKRMESEGPLKLDVQLTRSELKLAIKPKRRTKSELPEIQDSDYDQLKLLKQKMDSVKHDTIISFPSYSKNTFSSYNNGKSLPDNNNLPLKLSHPETTQTAKIMHYEHDPLNIRKKMSEHSSSGKEDSIFQPDRRRYTPIAPTKARMAYVEGIDSQKFTEDSKPLINYKLYI